MLTRRRFGFGASALGLAGALSPLTAADARAWQYVEAAGLPPLMTQVDSRWCWAATISNLFRCFGRSVSQTTIVKRLYGDTVDFASGPFADLSELLNTTWTDERTGAAFDSRLLAAYDETSAALTAAPPSPTDVVAAIANNQPLVLATATHAMLVVGVDYVTDAARNVLALGDARVWDPLPPGRFRTVAAGPGGEFQPGRTGGRLQYLAAAVVS
jgi:peptidase C39-like protein